MTKQDPDQRSPQETARIRDESVRRMIATPPTKLKDEPKRPRVKKAPAKPPMRKWPWER